MRGRVGGVVITVVVLLAGAACDSGGGGDGDGDGDGDVAAFCRLIDEANQASGETSSEQIEAIVEAAPSEIKDDARVLGDALRRMQDDPSTAAELLEDDEFTAAGERVDAFQAEHCPEGQ